MRPEPELSSQALSGWGAHRVRNVWSKFPSTASLVMFSSVAQSCLTLCDPMNCSMPGLPVHHQLPESTRTHVRQVSDAIQPSRPLLSLLLLPPPGRTSHSSL